MPRKQVASLWTYKQKKKEFTIRKKPKHCGAFYVKTIKNEYFMLRIHIMSEKMHVLREKRTFYVKKRTFYVKNGTFFVKICKRFKKKKIPLP